jgi:hypothetical protein
MNKAVSVFKCDVTGIVTTYTYRGSSITSGMEKAEFEYPKGYLEQFAKQQKMADNLPKTRRLYYNPATGKDVSYARARTLGLLKKI